MSAFVLEQDEIEVLVPAVNAVLELNQQYCHSYYLSESTRSILSKYTGDLHSLYRILYIFNIKAVNGRYNDNVKEFPKYRPLNYWPTKDWLVRLPKEKLKCAISTMRCYMYQCCEDATVNQPLYAALREIQKTLCFLYCSMVIE